jgi:hypothetical protein
MAGVAARADAREGLSAMLVLGASHAAFSLLLHVAGHAPRRGAPGLPSHNHYLLQALFVVPLYLVLWRVGGAVAHALCRRMGGSAGAREASLAVFGVAYAVPMTLLFILPDVAVFFTLGFGAIGRAMRYYAPLAALSCVALGAAGFSRAHAILPRAALLAVLVGFVAQAALGGVLLR